MSGILIGSSASPVPATRSALAVFALALVAALAATGKHARGQEPPPYGPAITLEQARRVLAAAEEEAKKNNWPVAISIVDGAGYLVAFARLENTQLGSVEVSQEKAKTSALFRRPTKAFEDILAMGGVNLKLLKLPGALPIEGGLPIIHDGKVIGAIGVSGVKSVEDAQVAAAGLAALNVEE